MFSYFDMNVTYSPPLINVPFWAWELLTSSSTAPYLARQVRYIVNTTTDVRATLWRPAEKPWMMRRAMSNMLVTSSSRLSRRSRRARSSWGGGGHLGVGEAEGGLRMLHLQKPMPIQIVNLDYMNAKSSARWLCNLLQSLCFKENLCSMIIIEVVLNHLACVHD